MWGEGGRDGDEAGMWWGGDSVGAGRGKAEGKDKKVGESEGKGEGVNQVEES